MEVKLNIMSFFKPKPSIVERISSVLSPKKPNKLKLLHLIETDKAKYHIYNIDLLEGTNVSVWIERDGKSILETEIFDESWGTLGGDSFSSFVMSCLNVLRKYIKENNEFIIEDKILKSKCYTCDSDPCVCGASYEDDDD